MSHRETDGMSHTDVQRDRLLEGFTGSSPGYINSCSSGLNLQLASIATNSRAAARQFANLTHFEDGIMVFN